MIYRWREAAHIRGVEAQAAGEHLERLRKKNHGLTARVVVSDARDKKSVLHPAFEWNDRKAAEAFRLGQARHLIASVVVVRDDKTAAEPIRAFVVVENDGEQTYTSINVALTDPTMRAQVLARARTELEQWRTRYQELEEFAAVFSVIDKTVSEVA